MGSGRSSFPSSNSAPWTYARGPSPSTSSVPCPHSLFRNLNLLSPAYPSVTHVSERVLPLSPAQTVLKVLQWVPSHVSRLGTSGSTFNCIVPAEIGRAHV